MTHDHLKAEARQQLEAIIPHPVPDETVDRVVSLAINYSIDIAQVVAPVRAALDGLRAGALLQDIRKSFAVTRSQIGMVVPEC